MTHVKLKDLPAQESSGILGRSSPILLPLKVPSTELHHNSLPMCMDVHNSAADTSGSCSVMLKKKKRNIALKLSHTTSLDVFQRVFFCLFPGACLLIYVCLFTLGKGLILKEYIITQNNRPQHAGTAGVIGSEMQSSEMLPCQCS